jgi:hypothetical protein
MILCTSQVMFLHSVSETILGFRGEFPQPPEDMGRRVSLFSGWVELAITQVFIPGTHIFISLSVPVRIKRRGWTRLLLGVSSPFPARIKRGGGSNWGGNLTNSGVHGALGVSSVVVWCPYPITQVIRGQAPM